MTTPAHTPAIRSVGFLLGMCTLMLGASLVRVSYNGVLLPTLVKKVVTGSKGLVVGLAGSFGTLLAILVSILWRIISGHTTSRWGKRTPAVLAGALGALPMIGLAPLIFGVLLVIMTKTAFRNLFIISAILFPVGGIVFSLKVPQRELDASISTQLDIVGDVA